MSEKKKSGAVVSGTGDMRGITSRITRSTPIFYHVVARSTNRKSSARNDAALCLLRQASTAVDQDDVKVANEWNLLAVMIIARAVADWNKLAGRDQFTEYRCPIYREGLIRFFNSRWCSMLLECTDVTQKELMDAVGVPTK